MDAVNMKTIYNLMSRLYIVLAGIMLCLQYVLDLHAGFYLRISFFYRTFA